MKGMFSLDKKVEALEPESLYISEITLAELKFGVANSTSPEKNRLALEQFLTGVQVLPIFDAIEVYATEKSRLRKLGLPVDDFDLLIGASAIANDLILVTNNEKHFHRLTSIEIENWTQQP